MSRSRSPFPLARRDPCRLGTSWAATGAAASGASRPGSPFRAARRGRRRPLSPGGCRRGPGGAARWPCPGRGAGRRPRPLPPDRDRCLHAPGRDLTARIIATAEWKTSPESGRPGPCTPMTLGEMEDSIERVLGVRVTLEAPPATAAGLLRRLVGRNTPGSPSATATGRSSSPATPHTPATAPP